MMLFENCPKQPFICYINLVQLLAVVAYMAIGFLVSLISEGFCLIKLLPVSSDRLWRTALIMNLRSYSYIAIPLTVLLLRIRNWA